MNLQAITRTNRQRLSVSYHLQQLQQLSQDSVLSDKVAKQACNQALSFSCFLWYRAFLAELANDFHLTVDADDGFCELVVKLQGESAVCLQCQNLAELEVDGSSWLFWLLSDYHACVSLHDRTDSKTSVPQNNIKIKDLVGLSQIEKYQQVVNCFLQIIEQYRELMQEW